MPGNSRSRQKRKRKLEPISYEEMLGAAGMSGFVSFLEITPSDAEQPVVDASSRSTKLVSPSPSPEHDTHEPGVPDAGVPGDGSVVHPPNDQINAGTSAPTSHVISQRMTVVDHGTPALLVPVTGAPTEGIPDNIDQMHQTGHELNLPPLFTTDRHAEQIKQEITPGIPIRGIPIDTSASAGVPVSSGQAIDADHDPQIELLQSPDYKTAEPEIATNSGIPDIGTPSNSESIIAGTFSGANPIFPPRSAPSIQEAHGTNRDRETIRAAIRYPVPGPGIPDKQVIPIGPYATSTTLRTHRLRRATRVQDGHSLGEQALYDALWQAAQPYSADARIIMVGYRRMSELARLTVNNCKANIKALIQKLAVDEAAPFSHSQGTTYVVYNFSAILQRRKAAGLTFYIRSRGVVFVDPETGLPLTSSTHSKSGTPDWGWSRPISIPESDNTGIPIADRSGAPEAASHKERNRISQQLLETSSTLPVPEDLIQAFHKILPAIDNDAITTIWNECRARAEDCTAEEIAYFARSKAIALNNGKIQNPVGFLLAAIPKCFEGQTFQIFRQEEARRRQEQQRREEEEREERLQFEEHNRREAEAYRKAEETLTNLSQSERDALYERVQSDLRRNYPHINWPNRQALEDRIRIGMIRELQKRAGV